MSEVPDHLQFFTHEVNGIPLPGKFTFPFYYDPHPLALLATAELQEYLANTSLEHNFGFEGSENELIIGKMFGVLVVQTASGELGYLSAFSGKLQSGNIQERFVPPVYDMLTPDGFFLQEEAEISAINSRIEALENDPHYHSLLLKRNELERSSELELKSIKQQIKLNKAKRKEERANLNESEHFTELEALRMESIREQYYLKDRTKYWNDEKLKLNEEIERWSRAIDELKMERKKRSFELQGRLFDSYRFLNSHGEHKSLATIFSISEDNRPPAGAGECCAPKLLHYAYSHQLKPITMAEFWWGASPQGEIRKHGEFYPACKGKCEPILGHMLEGLSMDPNPLIEFDAPQASFEVIFEDEYMLAINKPPNLLSVPGVNISDSVLTRVRKLYPDATGPMIVHRLDMGTSGILLIAKDERTYKILQRQFMKRKVEKKYVAILDGVVQSTEGIIELPLRVDLDDRPRQLVCYEHGKHAVTEFRVVESREGRTLVEFHPITGRTHQLRVHSAHPQGLSIPILGDDLYGKKDARMYLHAEELSFHHPVSNELIVLKKSPDSDFYSGF